MDIEMLPNGDGCQCADCRAERGDTQFAEFMGRVDAFAARVQQRNRMQGVPGLQRVVDAVTESFASLGDTCAGVTESIGRLSAAIPPDGR